MSAIAAAKSRLDELAASDSGPEDLERFIVDVFVERNRSIRNADFQRLDARAVSDDYLKPRAELYRFIVTEWIRLIFIPSLKPRVAGELFMFGLGRLFSSYNDMGCQHCTDVDLNIVAGDALSKADLDYLAARLEELRRRLYELFGIVLEIDPAYTILKAGEVAARLAHADEEIREANARFYKSNEKSIHVIKDHASIREGLFSLVRSEPDCRIFENFLGIKGSKPSYAKLRAGSERLGIIAEGGEKVLAAAIIGSKPFDAYCRKSLPPGPFLSPPDWVFLDEVLREPRLRLHRRDALPRPLARGDRLRRAATERGRRSGPRGRWGRREDAGLDAGRAAATGRGDGPRLPLPAQRAQADALPQELITISIGSYGGAKCDYSYISRSRFLRFMEINGDNPGSATWRTCLRDPSTSVPCRGHACARGGGPEAPRPAALSQYAGSVSRPGSDLHHRYLQPGSRSRGPSARRPCRWTRWRRHSNTK